MPAVGYIKIAYRVHGNGVAAVHGKDPRKYGVGFALSSLRDEKLGGLREAKKPDGHQECWQTANEHENAPGIVLEFFRILRVVANVQRNYGPSNRWKKSL